MCRPKARVLSFTNVIVLITVNIVAGRHLLVGEKDYFSRETRRAIGGISGQPLQDADYILPAHGATQSFTGQEDSLHQYSDEVDEKSRFVRANMIPCDFSQEPEEPYVSEVVTDTSEYVTSEDTASTQKSVKPSSTTISITTASTDGPQPPTAMRSLPVTAVTSTASARTETQTAILTTKSPVVTSIPSTTTNSFSTEQSSMSTTVLSAKSTTSASLSTIITSAHDPTTTISLSTLQRSGNTTVSSEKPTTSSLLSTPLSSTKTTPPVTSTPTHDPTKTSSNSTVQGSTKTTLSSGKPTTSTSYVSSAEETTPSVITTPPHETTTASSTHVTTTMSHTTNSKLEPTSVNNSTHLIRVSTTSIK